jgi:tellurite resistance protein TerC
MEIGVHFWIAFNLFVVLMLALDLGVFHRKRRDISIKDALTWTFVWIVLAFAFAGIVALWQGRREAAEFITGYVIEKALSLDNIFVIALIFAHFKTPSENQHKILFWGIIGALIMRALFIIGGVALLEKFHWMIYIFGSILIYTGIRILLKKHEEVIPEKNWLVKFCIRHLRFTHELHRGKFFVKIDGKRFATPLFLVLLVVEITDVMFAVDSIPAILAITHNSFIVYTSNVFAILGLRSLYFALAGIIDKFTYLQASLAIILVFVGCKMMLEDFIEIPIYITLPAIIVILGGGILFSAIKRKRRKTLDVQDTPNNP